MASFKESGTWCCSEIILTVLCVFLVYKCAKHVFGKATNKPLLNFFGRRLGQLEQMLDCFSVERGGTGNLCVRISLISKRSLSHQQVREALVLLAKRQPMLRATITTLKNEDKYFVIKEINEVIPLLDISTSDVKASDWKDVWYKYTAKQRENGLLWRVVILQEQFTANTRDYANTILFNFNHSAIDGVSSVKFSRQFHIYLNELANRKIQANHEISSLQMLPYFHNIITYKRAWYTILNFLLTYCYFRPILRWSMKRMISGLLKTTKCNPYYSQFPPSLDISSFAGPNRLNAKVFSENETNNIIQACKTNNCTVTGAVLTAAHLAFCELIHDGMNKVEDKNLKHEFTINAQRYCDPKPPEDYLGHFVYSAEEFYIKYRKGTDADFWILARETTEKIQNIVKSEACIRKETMMCETIKPRELLDLLNREVLIRASCCNYVSNYGSFTLNQMHGEQIYKLDEFSSYNIGQGFPGTFSHFIQTINGQMTWSIISDVSRVDTHHSEKFVNLCFGRFHDIAICKK